MSSVNLSKAMLGRSAGRNFSSERAAELFEGSAAIVLRYGLALIILWFGLFKFTPSEAQAIQPLVSNSPLLSWLYVVAGLRGASRVIGVAEIAISLLMFARPLSPRASAVGSVGATVMFLTTLSFLATTPGSWAIVDGFLVPAGAGSFLIKDLLLLGAALWSAGEALAASFFTVRR